MIDVFAARNASPLTTSPLASPQQPGGGKVLRMVQSSRTAGSMPVWSAATTPQNSVELSLSQAIPETREVQNNLGLLDDRGQGLKSETAPFGFADILDMINPLQHIPVVSHLYRSISGDSIRPASQIVGGTLFGGAAGLASGIVNVIAEHETGRDITGNALRLLTEGKAPEMIRKNASDIQTAALEPAAGMTDSVMTDKPAATDELLAFDASAGRPPDTHVNQGLKQDLNQPQRKPLNGGGAMTALAGHTIAEPPSFDLPASLLAFTEPAYAAPILQRPVV
jgi:hypothetical protein